MDPIYGNDGTGTGTNDVQSYFNPQAQTTQLDCGVAVNAPHSVLDPGQSNAVLLHAPHPFKTITAAIAYVNRLRAGPTAPPPLPHTDPGTNVTWAYCIIHLLPGWYGHPVTFQRSNNSSLSTDTDTQWDNALVPNGETFPLHLPPRVSLKGTSVLNTVIDLGGIGTAIEFGRIINGVELDGEGSFVDSITFYSCGIRGSTEPRDHAAILLDDEVSSHPTISNCVFAVNMIGVLVNAHEGATADAPEPPAHHGTTIVNCTFAWNGIGLWNGQLDVPDWTIDIATGVSKLNLINNIFDGSAPNGGNFLTLPCNLGSASLPLSWPNNRMGLQVASAFEGVSKEDLQVRVDDQPVDTNAYELRLDDRNYNRRARPPPPGAGNIPVTDPRVPGTFDPDPGKDLAFITGHPNQGGGDVRGILYIADLICHGRAAGATAFPDAQSFPGFDGSMLDFRLSPAVAPFSSTNSPPSQLNPLVDAGFDGPFPALMANGQGIANPPGYLVLNAASQDSWRHHNWETDGEGYANPRIHDHPVYANTGPGIIDVGADEVANLIVTGQRLGTSSFLGLRGGVRGSGSNEPHPDNPETRDNIPVDNRRLWYLGPPTSLTPAPNMVPQPSYRTYGVLASTQVYPATYLPKTWHSGEVSGTAPNRPWYAIRNNQITSRAQPPPVRPTCVCTSCSSGITAADLGNAYRATLADVTPHLLPDVHPWWSPLGEVAFGVAVHVMAPSFHLWQNCNGTSLCDPSVSWQPNPLGFYNSYLYQDPLAGNVNPPGAALGMTDSVTMKTFTWLDGQNEFLEQPRAVPFSAWQANPFNITDFDAWCRGGTGSDRQVLLPSTLDTGASPPAEELTALRFSLEWADDEELWLPVPEESVKNIQSFLVVVEQNQP